MPSYYPYNPALHFERYSGYAENRPADSIRTPAPNVEHREDVNDYPAPEDTEGLQSLKDLHAGVMTQLRELHLESALLSHDRAILAQEHTNIRQRYSILQRILSGLHAEASALDVDFDGVLEEISSLALDRETIEATITYLGGTHDGLTDATLADMLQEHTRNNAELAAAFRDCAFLGQQVVEVGMVVEARERQRMGMERMMADHEGSLREIEEWAAEVDDEAVELLRESEELLRQMNGRETFGREYGYVSEDEEVWDVY